jgi:short subunit dehydrogenase-like uncharacterized protein
MPLVEACAGAVTDWANLTGALLLVGRSLGRFDAVAASSGARIVHWRGFNSIPSDLGVLLLFEQVRHDDKGTLEDTTLVVTSIRAARSRAGCP